MKKKAQFFNEQNHLNDAAIVLYSNAIHQNRVHELPDELLDHVEACSYCRKRIHEYAVFYSEFKRDEAIDRKPETNLEVSNNQVATDSSKTKIRPASRVGAWRLGIAATLALLIVSLIVFNNLYKPSDTHTSQSEDHTSSNTLDSSKIASEDSKIAPNKSEADSNRQEVPKQEAPASEPSVTQDQVPTWAEQMDVLRLDGAIAFLDEQVESNTFRAETLNIIKPKIDELLRDEIIFEWEEGQEDELELHIFSIQNQEDPLVFSISSGEIRIVPNVDLSKGLYYWAIFGFEQEFKKRIALGRFFYIP